MNTKLIIFGATGDLVIKKIAPSLIELLEENKLDSSTQIIGFARRNYSNQDYFNFLNENLKNHKTSEKFENQTSFVSSEFDVDKGYLELQNLVNENDNVIYYFSVAPDFYEVITKQLKKFNLNFENSKVLMEKPIGKNLEEARKIENILSESFNDSQIYRIDHYLQKKMLKNIFAFRFYNSTFKANWNNQFIESIHVYAYENFGVENRGDFYDPLGALRDVGQNHLLQLLVVTTMDEPESFDPDSIRKSRAALFSQVEVMTKEKASKQSYRAQHKGYLDVEGVSENSKTETYFKIVTQLDSPRWRNVPIILEAGKSLNRNEIKVVVNFRKNTKKLSGSFPIQNIENKVEFSFKPSEKIDIGFDLISESLDQGLVCTIEERAEQQRYVEEYKHVILDSIKGDLTWFVSKEEVFEAWKFIDPIEEAWKEDLVDLKIYDQNSNQPIEESKSLNNYFNQIKIDKKIGLIGLGKMGMGIAKQLHEKGWEVVATNRSNEKVQEIRSFGVNGVDSVDEMINQLDEDRKIIWLMVSSDAVDEVLFGENGLDKHLSSGDIIIEAGNSHYKETIKRAAKLKEKGIILIDAGISGGPSGARNGASVMVGGDKQTFDLIEPVFKDISLPGAYRHFKGNGVGHFVKMVHNGIEYGMMQAIAEGFNLMKESDFSLDLQSISEIYNRGSVLESRLINWLYKAYQLHSVNLENVTGEVGHLGEGEWTVETAREFGVPVKVIEDALNFRFESKGNPSYTGKIISALREQFGGHRVNN